MVLGSEQHQDFLKHSLAIIDAKSLFDYLAKDTVGGQDRRTAIEIQIIREDLRHLQGQVRWVDHPGRCWRMASRRSVAIMNLCID